MAVRFYGDPARWLIFRFKPKDWVLIPPQNQDDGWVSYSSFDDARNAFIASTA